MISCESGGIGRRTRVRIMALPKYPSSFRRTASRCGDQSPWMEFMPWINRQNETLFATRNDAVNNGMTDIQNVNAGQAQKDTSYNRQLNDVVMKAVRYETSPALNKPDNPLCCDNHSPNNAQPLPCFSASQRPQSRMQWPPKTRRSSGTSSLITKRSMTDYSQKKLGAEAPGFV
jgi:hypothetical protein